MSAILKFIKKSQSDTDETPSKDFISLVFRPIIAILFSIMILITFAQVIFRYVLNSAFAWAGELTIFLFIWVIFLGAVIALSKGMHIGVDIFSNLLSKKKQKKLLIFTNMLIITFCFLVIVGAAPLIIDNFTQRSPALGIRITYIYLSIPVSMFAMIWITLKNNFKLMKK
ncbi:TRAP transporter small permease [Pelagibacteraceae bacterium]|nr:TRAP transporter small permease [Pelagibacteraceae bacterium]